MLSDQHQIGPLFANSATFESSLWFFEVAQRSGDIFDNFWPEQIYYIFKKLVNINKWFLYEFKEGTMVFLLDDCLGYFFFNGAIF